MVIRETNAAPVVESDLVARVRQRDESAVRDIIRKNNRRLFRLVRAVVRDDGEAEDIVQETYVRAFAQLAGFRGESSLSTWLARIALNEAYGRLRQRRRTFELSHVQAIAPGQAQILPFPAASSQLDPERAMAQREINALIERAIDALPEPFRVVLVARLVEEMSVEETAALLGLRPETVKTRLHRARRLLRSDIERQVGPLLANAFPFAGARCERVAEAVLARLKSSW